MRAVRIESKRTEEEPSGRRLSLLAFRTRKVEAELSGIERDRWIKPMRSDRIGSERCVRVRMIREITFQATRLSRAEVD